MFTDRVILTLKAGKGGNGIVCWRREKYIPKGGPYGGNGGKGGSIILEVDQQIPSLESFRNTRTRKAENGVQGGPNNRQGRHGRDLILKIPCGTLVKEVATGMIIHDFTEDKEKKVLCRGGRGGNGNSYFKSPTNRAPNTATPGKMGEGVEVELELKLIADVGLVGFPNAGKSTLISSATDIKVKMAPYPFTTLRPNLGYLIEEDGERILFADIPGIIAGAHKNKGLGLEFLRHIERTKILLFVIDAFALDGRDPVEDFAVLQSELKAYNPELLEKPFLVALNKIDCEEAQENIRRFHERFDVDTVEISALTGQGIDELIGFLKCALNKIKKSQIDIPDSFLLQSTV